MTADMGRSGAKGISGPDQSDVGPAYGAAARQVAVTSLDLLNGLRMFFIVLPYNALNNGRRNAVPFNSDVMIVNYGIHLGEMEFLSKV